VHGTHEGGTYEGAAPGRESTRTTRSGNREEDNMDDPTADKWAGRWDQLKGKVRQQWGELTDDDVDVAEGRMEELVGRIRERTGESQEEIRRQLDEW
jgi:uncharacterized protein YjbJ (UPF0337 family)